MTAVPAQTDARTVTLPWLLRRATIATWHELPRVIAVSALSLVSLVPLVVAILTSQWWLIALGSLPASLMLTGMARFAAEVQLGNRPAVRVLLRVDPVLALTISTLGSVAALLVTDPTLQVVGFLLAATTAVVVPYALAYGAVRGRRGLTTWRGAVILVAYRPSWALTVLSVSLIGAFLVVASVGALALVVPCVISVFTASVVATLLDTIDGTSR